MLELLVGQVLELERAPIRSENRILANLPRLTTMSSRWIGAAGTDRRDRSSFFTLLINLTIFDAYPQAPVNNTKMPAGSEPVRGTGRKAKTPNANGPRSTCFTLPINLTIFDACPQTPVNTTEMPAGSEPIRGTGRKTKTPNANGPGLPMYEQCRKSDVESAFLEKREKNRSR